MKTKKKKLKSLLKMTKLSELLAAALHDLRQCENRPEEFRIDMSYYFKQRERTCAVCLAGACLTGRDSPDGVIDETGRIVELQYGDPGQDLADRLIAVDLLRSGSVDDACHVLFGSYPSESHQLNRRTALYHLDRAQFHKDMEALLADLKAAGL